MGTGEVRKYDGRFENFRKPKDWGSFRHWSSPKIRQSLCTCLNHKILESPYLLPSLTTVYCVVHKEGYSEEGRENNLFFFSTFFFS